MADALIGFSGFVGSTLLRQVTFGECYRSTNIRDIDHKSFGTIVCAGAPAQKWIANRDPDADQRKIGTLIGHLERVQCNRFILISTVDVFMKAVAVDEDTDVEESGLHAYGLHRRQLEKFVANRFGQHLIIRLPGLVGPGLRKNIVFDFLNDNNLDAVDSRAVFQFYPMVNLWYDIQRACDAGLHLVHLTAEPVTVAEIAREGFGKAFNQILADAAPPVYDMRTRYGGVFGLSRPYQYTARESFQAIRAYAQSEPLSVRLDARANA